MKFFSETPELATLEYSWVSNGKYPLITFPGYVFTDDFEVVEGETTLVEGVDYIRVIKSNPVYLRFSLDVFGGIVLLTTTSRDLSITYRLSAEYNFGLPTSVSDPLSVTLDNLSAPFDGSHSALVDIINEIAAIVPELKGNILPIYVAVSFDTPLQTLSLTSFTIKYDVGSITNSGISSYDGYAYPRMNIDAPFGVVPMDYNGNN